MLSHAIESYTLQLGDDSSPLSLLKYFLVWPDVRAIGIINLMYSLLVTVYLIIIYYRYSCYYGLIAPSIALYGMFYGFI